MASGGPSGASHPGTSEGGSSRRPGQQEATLSPAARRLIAAARTTAAAAARRLIAAARTTGSNTLAGPLLESVARIALLEATAGNSQLESWTSAQRFELAQVTAEIGLLIEVIRLRGADHPASVVGAIAAEVDETGAEDDATESDSPSAGRDVDSVRSRSVRSRSPLRHPPAGCSCQFCEE